MARSTTARRRPRQRPPRTLSDPAPEDPSMPEMPREAAIRAVLSRIDAAWRTKRCAGLEDCFAEDATIAGPGCVRYAAGRAACAESYREFASNAAVLDYTEDGHELRSWPDVAVYTFRWTMTYQRDQGPKRESGTDELVLGRFGEHWRVVFRHIEFAPAS
jgi:ketosteroid isomerase-like protein